MAKATDQSVSVLGAAYLQPVADLVERLLKWPATKRNAVRARYYDNTYAVSIILLLVAMVESFAARVRYFNGPGSMKRPTVAEYIKNVFPAFRLSKALTEVFVIRDAIFHNHLWTIDYTWRPITLKFA